MGTHRKRWGGTAALVLSLSLLAAAPASADVLWSQSGGDTGTFTTSQDYAGLLNALDARAADDFAVPEGVRWRIEQVNVGGRYVPPSPATLPSVVNVAFFRDAGAVPGELVTSEGVLNPGSVADGNFQIPINPVELDPGSYWVSVQSVQSGAEVWQWANRAHVDGTDSTAIEPLVSLLGSCTAGLWTADLTACGLPGIGTDLVFDLLGTVINTALPGLPGGGTSGGGSTGSGGSTGGTTGTQTAKDTRRPRLSLSVRGRQRVLRQRGVILRASSDEAGTLVGKGTVTVPSRLARVLKLSPAGLKVSANRMGTVKLRLSRRSLRAVKRAFGKRRTLTARVSMTAFDEAGNYTTARRRIKLRR
jgi:hypothetical protein